MSIWISVIIISIISLVGLIVTILIGQNQAVETYRESTKARMKNLSAIYIVSIALALILLVVFFVNL
ncbi:hypothetical protein [Bacillus sp. UMB0893]|uniref:hypothetical protein n=1 Tax=Bacillus sp. UMB0893 TaxID=2066053 RepID=UPI000C766AB0|nr:hypothetical protein [Bacillus sp. UMB0893]PLR68844.1 hypothetical protein CYJ36_07795 [Bacillus sp. UMB0893]QNG58370.1 hypothetical protein H4O14_10895 [Bacillus sp. PAMC26568]